MKVAVAAIKNTATAMAEAKIYILTTFVLLGVLVRVSNAGVISVFVSRLVIVETVNVV